MRRFVSRGTLLWFGLLLLLPMLAQFHYLVPDSAAHVAWARSLLWDGDVDFANEYARLGSIDRDGEIAFAAPTEVGRPGNPFGLGSALVWSPWVGLAALVAALGAALGAPFACDGFGTLTLFAVHLGTWTAAFATALATAQAAREAEPEVAPGTLGAALVAALAGTPFIYYVLQLASYSHVAAAAVVALLLWLSLRWRAEWTAGRAAVLGLVLGFGGLVRVQDLGWVALPLGLGAWGGALGRPRAWRLGALLVATAAVAFSPQLLAWRRIYGGAFEPPQGPGFLQFSATGLFGVLFSSRHGWLVWTPVALLGLAGVLSLVGRRATRGLGGALLAGLVLQWVANALPLDWWAGWSFGARRFVDATPVLALGLVAWARRGRAARAALWGATAVGLVQWLRVATRALGGEADPGWNALWGTGFLGFLPRLPAAIAAWLLAPWNDLQILRRPHSVAPTLHSDPAAGLVVLYVLWALALLLARWRLARAPR